MSALTPAVRPFEAVRPRFRLGPLLALTGPLALLATAVVLASPALTVQDSWLTLLSGREVAQHGLPSADHLTVLASGHPWVDQQWLAALLLYGAACLGGVGLAFAACALALLAAFALAALVAYERDASPLSILFFVAAAVVCAPWGLQMRAQALALPLFTFVLWLLLRDPGARRRSTMLVLPALGVWANVHGSVVVGVALVVVYALRTRRWRYLAAPAAMFVSPYAPQLPGYYRQMLLDPSFGRYIAEWHRTTPSRLTAAFFTLALLAIVLVVRKRARLTLFDVLALALSGAVALEAIRGLVWFALAALALLPALATRRPVATRFDGRSATISAALTCAVVGAALVVVAVRPPRTYDTRVPASLAGVVRTHTLAHQKVLADDATADWLLWQLPALRGRLAYDVRFEILTRAQIHRLLVWRNLEPGWEHVADGYSLVVDDPRHVARLVETGRWRRLFTSPRVAAAERIGVAR